MNHGAKGLLTPPQAESLVAALFGSASECGLYVSEKRAFDGGWLPLGDISIVGPGQEASSPIQLIRHGAFEWRLPGVDETAAKACRLLGVVRRDAQNDAGKARDYERYERNVRLAMAEVTSAITRVGMIHPRFDPASMEQMPFRRSTTIVVDTSAVLQGALDFVARFLHPAARVKIPAITHMEIANQADRFLRVRRARRSTPGPRIRELREHLASQGGQRALLRVELQADTEVERTYLLGDPLRSAFDKDSDSDLQGLDISSPVRSYADRLILESARHHQAQSGPAHIVRLLTGDQGLARMAMAEGVRPLYFTATDASDVFDQHLAGQTFDPFSGHVRYTGLTTLLWELATAFGSAKLVGQEDSVFEVSALGEDLSWAPYHAEEDLLWCVATPPASQASGVEGEATTGSVAHDAAAEPSERTDDRQPELLRGSREAGRTRATARATSAARVPALRRFNVERLFRLVCALDDYREMPASKVEEALGGRGNEYRLFLQSGDLVEVSGGVWRAGEGIQSLATALRNERVEDMREALLDVPSFAGFAGLLGDLGAGEALDVSDLKRGLATYRALGEVGLICATAGGSIHATRNLPSPGDFARVALDCFSSLDREGHGLVATGAWLEALIRDVGIHPEVARRQLDVASGMGLLRRSTEGSTTELRFRDRTVHVLRIESGLPVVEEVYLYRGDYLIPGKASVSLRIEGPAR